MKKIFMRNALAVVIFVAMVAIAEPVAASPESASQFVDRFANQALESLNVPDMSLADREALVRGLLRRGLDLNFIGRFAFGNYWSRARPDQRSDYLALFEDFVVQSYTAWFARNSGKRLIVVDARQINDKDVVVNSRIDRQNKAPLYIEWRVRTFDDQERIIDIVSNGVSMAGNQRLEYSAVIKRKGIDGLINFLRERVAK